MMYERQRVTILPAVEEVMRQDMLTFMSRNNENGFINHVIQCMIHAPGVDMDHVRREREEYYRNTIEHVTVERAITIVGGKTPKSDLAMSLASEDVERIREQYLRECEAHRQAAGKNKRDVILRLQADTATLLDNVDVRRNWELSQDEVRRNPGAHSFYSGPKEFIERMLWNYAAMPANEREGVYFQDMIADLQSRIGSGHVLTITQRALRNSKYPPNRFRILPYSLERDTAGNHYYLIGIGEKLDEPSGRNGKVSLRQRGMRPMSLRVSRIDTVKSERTVLKWTQEQTREIRNAIHTRGAAYVLDRGGKGENEDIEIRLTAAGWQQYQTLSRNRPLYVRQEDEPEPDRYGRVTLRFHGAEQQIINFFMPFGRKAEILQPVSLRNSFAKQYEDAAQVYQRSREQTLDGASRKS